MRKLHALLLAVLLTLAFISPSFAEVGIKKDGVSNNIATDLNFRGAGTSITSDGSTLTFNLVLAGFANGGAVSMTTSELAISPSYSYVRKALSSTVGAAGTLANGTPGQLLTIFVTAVDGSGTLVLTPTTKTGYTTLTFNAVADSVTLLYVSDTVGWIVVGNVSVALA